MKLGEIKIEALKLMFANGPDLLTISNRDNQDSYTEPGNAALDLIEAAADPQYADYLNNINGSINRCFSILESRHVLPTKRYTLVNGSDELKRNMEFDLSEIPDLDDIQRVVIQRGTIYDSNADYKTEGNFLIIPLVMMGDSIRLIYYPRIERLSQTADDNQEIKIPDKIACLIPYYVKFDLFREDDEREANTALNQFENALAYITEMQGTHQGAVDSDYGMIFNGWWPYGES